MAGPNASRKRKGGRASACSYCGVTHRKGRRRGNSCGGRSVRAAGFNQSIEAKRKKSE